MNMKTKKMTRIFSLKHFYKSIIYLITAILLLMAVTFFAVPFLFSSEFAKNRIASYLSEDLKRPVSIDGVSFSWNKGINISGFNVNNQDGSPLFGFKNLLVRVLWSSVVTGNIKVDAFTLDEINLTLKRDMDGRLNVSDLMIKEKKAGKKTKDTAGFKGFSGISMNTRINKGNITFIDRRLNTITHIKNLKAELSCRSLTRPVHIFIKCDVSINEKPPEPMELKGTLRLATKGKLDVKNAQGSLDMKSGFGNITAWIDLSKFNTSEKETGASLSCFLDLNKLSQMCAGFTGLPLDVSLKGFMEAGIQARGNFLTDIAVSGETVLKDVIVKGGAFSDKPFQQKRIVLIQDILIDPVSSLVDIKSMSFKSDMASLALSGTVSNFNEKPEFDLMMSGTGDIKKISHVLDKLRFYPPDLKLSGTAMLSLSGTGNFKTSHIKGSTGVKNFIFNQKKTGSNQSAGPVAIPEILLTHDILYTADNNKLTVNSLKADASFFHLNGSGSITQITRQMLTQFKGDLTFDMSELQKRLKNILPEKFIAQGSGKVSFDCSGTLIPAEGSSFLDSFKGTGALFAESIRYIDFGSIKNIKSTRLSFEKGVLFANLEGIVNKGRLLAENVFDFNKIPFAVNMNIKGTGIELSQDLKLLGYVVPVLIVQPSGRLSGKADFSIHASCNGMDWESEIIKTLAGYGTISFKHGSVSSSSVLSAILKFAGESDTMEFEEILTDFRLSDEKIYNDNITVNGNTLDLIVKGWTSLSYDPFLKGNPIQYSVEGDFFKKNLGRDAKKIFSFFGMADSQVPVVITGTVQKPKIVIKKPEPKDLIKGLFDSLR